MVLNGVLLALFQYWRNRSVLTETSMFVVLNTFAFLNTLLFVLEDEYLAGIQMIINSPNAIGTLIFTGLFLMLKAYLRLIW